MSAQTALAVDEWEGVPFVTTFHEKPWRHYQVHPNQTDTAAALEAKKGVRVPSVTQVTGATVDKSRPFTYHAERETVAGLDTLNAQYGADDGIFRDPERLEAAILATGREFDARSIVELYESQQTTLPWGYPEDLLKILKDSEESGKAKLQRAADRGTSIHNALEEYAKTGKPFNPSDYPDEWRGYFTALARWLVKYRPTFHGSEVIVGSLRHRYGGRLDHHMTLDAKGGTFDSFGVPLEGRGLIDLKTGKGRVYPVENFTQVAGYDLAGVESGLPPTDFQAVLAVGADGSYQFCRSTVGHDDFLVALEWLKRQRRTEAEFKKAQRDAKAAAKAQAKEEGS